MYTSQCVLSLEEKNQHGNEDGQNGAMLI